jgi:hypothetical protein
MTWVRDVYEMGFHVVEDDNDDWVIAPCSKLNSGGSAVTRTM